MSEQATSKVDAIGHIMTGTRLRDKKSLRSYIYALMAFQSAKNKTHSTSMSLPDEIKKVAELQSNSDTPRTILYAGVSAHFDDGKASANVAIALRDTVYSIDYAISEVNLATKSGGSTNQGALAQHIIAEISQYSRNNMAKIIGLGVPRLLTQKIPELCSRLWLELDIISIVLDPANEKRDFQEEDDGNGEHWDDKSVDEQADSLARKCIMQFGPDSAPVLHVGYRGIVKTDGGFRASLLSQNNYESTCDSATWKATGKYVDSLKKKKTKIAFFSSTPQGGGVALMRHALVRFSRIMGVDLKWYVPKPKPGVFRLTKNMHNILQGVSEPDMRLNTENFEVLSSWIKDNAERYWLSKGGPLRPISEGGADIIIIDDPQMPGLIPLIKALTPDRPVLYRSHIQVRSDLISVPGSPQAEVWDYLWSSIKLADMFISHPIPAFVPENVPREKVAYLPATTDWLDGLNKTVGEWDRCHYRNMYNDLCHSSRMTSLAPPPGKYVIQIARFDPAKGIPDVLASYAEFRRLLASQTSKDTSAPQLIICGHGSVDDPDGTSIYEKTLMSIYKDYADIANSISVMRLPPSDQLLNTLISSAHVCLQLSTREGFEVKVSEALHKGIPTIATKRGGIPLQVQHGKNGFLVEAGDFKTVASHLLNLWTDDGLHAKMSEYAKKSVSDEVGTVGNALAWFYLADTWTNGEKSESKLPRERWVNDLAREVAGVPYQDGESRLPRKLLE